MLGVFNYLAVREAETFSSSTGARFDLTRALTASWSLTPSSLISKTGPAASIKLVCEVFF